MKTNHQNELPAELHKTLAMNKEAADIFAALSISHRGEYVSWITEAKKAETRVSRAEKAVRMILEKKIHP